jgi:uncharacterized protein YjbI with pentapeptide repeats
MLFTLLASCFAGAVNLSGGRPNLPIATSRDLDYIRHKQGQTSVCEQWRDLKQAALDDADLSGADLRCADLTGASLYRARLVGADVTGSKLIGAKLDGADLTSIKADGSDFSSASLLQVDMSSGTFRRAVLQQATMVGSRAKSTDFSNADLTSIDARFLQMQFGLADGASWKFADLRGASWTGTRARCADLSKADFRGAEMQAVDLFGSATSEALGVDIDATKRKIADTTFARRSWIGFAYESIADGTVQGSVRLERLARNDTPDWPFSVISPAKLWSIDIPDDHSAFVFSRRVEPWPIDVTDGTLKLTVDMRQAQLDGAKPFIHIVNDNTRYRVAPLIKQTAVAGIVTFEINLSADKSWILNYNRPGSTRKTVKEVLSNVSLYGLLLNSLPSKWSPRGHLELLRSELMLNSLGQDLYDEHNASSNRINWCDTW